jgi:hypothetical protein
VVPLTKVSNLFSANGDSSHSHAHP